MSVFIDVLTDEEKGEYHYGHCSQDHERGVPDTGCGMEYAFYPATGVLEAWHDAVGRVTRYDGVSMEDVEREHDGHDRLVFDATGGVDREASVFVAVIEQARTEKWISLVYVHYDDRLTDDQVDAVVRNAGWEDDAWESFFEWTSEAQCLSASEWIEQAVKDHREAAYREHDDEDWLTLDLTFDQEEWVREVLYDRDDSKPLDDLLSNTPAQPLRVPLGEMPRHDDGTVSAAGLAEMLGVTYSDAWQRVIDEIMAEVWDGVQYLEVHLLAYVDLDPEWLDLPEDALVTFTTPHLWITNPYAGNGFEGALEDAGVTLTVKRGDLRTDRDAPGYSWQSVAGPHWPAYHSEIEVPK